MTTQGTGGSSSLETVTIRTTDRQRTTGDLVQDNLQVTTKSLRTLQVVR